MSHTIPWYFGPIQSFKQSDFRYSFASVSGPCAQENSLRAILPLAGAVADTQARMLRVVENRRAILNMVAHDIRTPLMSAQISLDLVEELSPELSEEAHAALDSLAKLLSLALAYVHDLLNRATLYSAQSSFLNLGGRLRSGSDSATAMSCLTNEVRVILSDALEMISTLSLLEADRLVQGCSEHLLRAGSGIIRSIEIIDDGLKVDSLFRDSVCLRKTVVAVRALAEDAILPLKNLAESRGIRIVNNCGWDFGNLDRSKVTQVVGNLLSNAAKAAPSESAIVLSSLSTPCYLRILVRDDGPGVDPAKQEELLAPKLRKTGKETQGFGLGLFICRLIAEAHGGRIGFANGEQRGCVFWIELPK